MYPFMMFCVGTSVATQFWTQTLVGSARMFPKLVEAGIENAKFTARIGSGRLYEYRSLARRHPPTA